MTERKLRFGVIGAGAFAETCHVPGLQSHPQAEVVALCGRRYDNARAMADRFGIPDVCTDFRELCARPDLDAVTIATPNAAHAEQARAAFAHGKHVFCEKPLGIDVAEVTAMLRAAEASGKVHQVGFAFRYADRIQELRRRLRAGDVGEPYLLRSRYEGWGGLQQGMKAGWRQKRELAGGGLLYDMGSHFFDMARFLLGPIVAATGFTHFVPRRRPDKLTGEPTEIETDDLAAAWFVHLSGVRGEWFMSRETPPFSENNLIEIVGPEGALRVGGPGEWLRLSTPAAPEWQPLPVPELVAGGRPEVLARMMRSFVDACLRGRLDGDIDASFADGLAAQQALAAIDQAKESLTWVRLPTPSPHR